MHCNILCKTKCVTKRDYLWPLPTMSPFQDHGGKLGSNIHERDITAVKRIERSLSDWVHLNNVGLCPFWEILRHLSIPQIRNFGQGSAHDSSKMEACYKIGKSWHGKVLKILAIIHKEHIRVDFDPKIFKYTEENKWIPTESVNLVMHNLKICYALFDMTFHA